jgi:hypothetical protein
MPDLTGTSTPIEIAPGGYQLRAPGLVGTVKEIDAQASATRGDGGLRDAQLLAAIDSAGLVSGKVFEIDVLAEAPAVTPEGTRADGLTAVTREGEPAVVFAMPHLEEGAEYAVLYTDEAGVSRWIFPTDAPAAAAPATRGAGSEVTFNLPRAVAPTPPEAQQGGAASRGPVSLLGRRVVRVLAWSAAPVIGAGVLAVAEQWEGSKRPYGFHLIEPDRYTQPKPAGSPVDWDLLKQGRALLLLHGTFSTSESAYAGFDRDTLQALAAHYGQRVFAFNHPSLHHSPVTNVQTLLEMLPPGISLDLDIITHSRGGLVGRELTERLAQHDTGGRQLRVHKAILVASPNQGTILADPENGIDLIDRYTNAIALLPDNAYTLIIEGVLALVKLLGVGALTGLPGMSAFRPGGEFLNSLNAGAPHQTEYYALTADYTPTAPGLLARMTKMVGNQFVDSVFKAANDMCVPTAGSYTAGNKSPGFPIPPDHRRVFAGADQVMHTNYFGTPVVRKQILDWLRS